MHCAVVLIAGTSRHFLFILQHNLSAGIGITESGIREQGLDSVESYSVHILSSLSSLTSSSSILTHLIQTKSRLSSTLPHLTPHISGIYHTAIVQSTGEYPSSPVQDYHSIKYLISHLCIRFTSQTQFHPFLPHSTTFQSPNPSLLRNYHYPKQPAFHSIS